MIKTYERTAIKLLQGQPRAKTKGRVIHGRFILFYESQHRTPQSRAFRRFIKMRERVDTLVK